MSHIRSLLYFAILTVVTPPWAALMILAFWLPHRGRRWMAKPWVKFNNWLIWHLLGITYEVRGAERIPREASVILCKHQSAWETFILQDVFRDTVYVWKKELKRIPFFGWALAVTPMISIDRSAGMDALRQLTDQGGERLRQDYNVIIFPEGTRAPPGYKRRYKSGGAHLAISAGAPVVPVALNSGEVWGKNAFVKSAGRVVVSIGPPIATVGRDADAVTAEAEAWIEAEMRRISPQLYNPDVPTPIATRART